MITPESFWETLFLIVIFLHLKLGNAVNVPGDIKAHLSRLSARKLLKNYLKSRNNSEVY